MSIDRWIDKEAVVCIYNGILLSHKKEHIWVSLMRWMNLEPVIQSEVSQKEESKDVLMHIYMEYRKNGTDESIWRERVNMQM